jgi:hypothetical protein
VALFSDMDWVIIAAVAAFLLFGKENGEILRTLGRWYGRAGRLKQDLLAEFTTAADLPLPGPGGAGLTIRGALLGLDPAPVQSSGIPAAVSTAPATPSPISPAPGPSPWTGGYPTPTWSMTVPVVPSELEVTR